MNAYLKFNYLSTFILSCNLLVCNNFAQANSEPSEFKSIDEVIKGIDFLLGDIKNSSNAEPYSDKVFPDNNSLDSDTDSFRVQNELMPNNLLGSERINVEQENSGYIDPVNLDDINPSETFGEDLTKNSLSGRTFEGSNVDFKSASLEELLREVDLLDLPAMELPLSSPVTSISASSDNSLPIKPEENLANPTVIETPLLNNPPEEKMKIEIPNYTVLGEEIDAELKAKIREAIMETRRASGGSDNPYVTRSVFKATSYCNRVLGRLNAPYHKRYRRDVLLSLIGMHERNQAWVDAAKSYERFLEEFAADDSYPFESHEDAPGIPDLKSSLGSLEKWLEGRKRGAPTIPETHIRLGKIYRSLGAHRMALNKFYDAINATLTLAPSDAFELAERKKGSALENRMDAESNQAMFEIAETFMDSEDYDNAIKFFERLWRLEQLEDSDRAVVRFKKGLAHYRRARENLRKEEHYESSSS